MFDWKEVKRIIARHSLLRENPAATPWEGLLIGNADMGATVFGPAHKLCFRLGKMDLWDARWNEKNYKYPLPLSPFKEYILKASKKLKHGQVVSMDLNDSWQGCGTLYPCMRMGADFLVRVNQPEGGLPVPMTQRLRLEDGLYEAEFVMGWWIDKPKIKCTSFVSWQHNVLAVKLQFPEKWACRKNVVVSIGRDIWGGRSWELLSSGPSIKGVKKPGFQRDPRVGMLPPAQLKTDENTASLWQVIPGDKYCPEKGFSVVATCVEEAEFFREPSGQIILEAFDMPQLTVFVALASETEAPNSMERALTLAKEAAQEGWERLYEKHAEAWKTYWMKSSVELEDKNLERSWVRDSYSLAINARSGQPAAGLYGVSTVYDCPPWRGDRHNNYPEYSSYFWGAFAANHEEQALNYTEFVYNYLPTARRIAREVFECKNGAAFPHCYIDGTEQYWFHFTWAWSLFLTALHAQNCWWHYQYFNDKSFLKKMAYPVMRECANFYVEMIKKNPPGDYTFWPTIATEIRGWTKNFEFNKNCIEDLAHIKFLMRAVLEASVILNIDLNERKAWKNILNHLPTYPTITIDGREEFIDFAGQKKRPKYNHSVPMAPFWPAEDPDIYNDPGLRKIGINTLSAHPWDHVRLTIAYMRLGMKNKVYEKLLGKKVKNDDDSNIGRPGTAGFLINEMLLSSWNGVLRIFPAWPLDKKAQFCDLRAKGAFLVSAACERGQITKITVLSEKGNVLKIESPWPNTKVRCKNTGKKITPVCDKSVMQWNTLAGQVFVLVPN